MTAPARELTGSDQQKHPPYYPHDDYLLSSDTWSGYEALQFIEEQLRASLSRLEVNEQERYLKLCHEEPRLKDELTQALKRFITSFQADALRDLRDALRSKTSKDIDPCNAYLRTSVLYVPPRDDAKDPIELIYRLVEQRKRPRRGLDPDAPVPKTVSKSLWQAAKENFAFTGSPSQFPDSERFLQHSTISATDEGTGAAVELSVGAFIDIVRNLDLGSRLRDELSKEMARHINGRLHAYQEAALELAVLEALRKGLLEGDDRRSADTFMQAFNDRDALIWDLYSLDFGRNYFPDFVNTQSIPLPFCLLRFSRGGPLGVFSYFPQRPGGALRYHRTSGEALACLRDQIRNDAHANAVGWLTRFMSLGDQATFLSGLKEQKVDPAELNWAASVLYNAFGDQAPPASRINLQRTPLSERSRTVSLLDHLKRIESQRITADIVSFAATSRSQDLQKVIDTGLWIVSQTLELLLIPIPGGVLGVSPLMIVASLGTLLYQTVVAAAQLAEGKKLEFVQAFTDVAELIISTKIQAVGARLSARRTRKLIESLGHARKVVQPDGTSALWLGDLQAYTKSDTSALGGLEADAQGLFKAAGNRLYVHIEVAGRIRMGEVVMDRLTQQYRLAHTDPDRYRPAVTFDSGGRYWKLAPVDISSLTDAQLLQKMMRPDLPTLNANELGRLMDMVALSRTTLEGIWKGDEPAPWEMNHALADLQVRKGLDQLQRAFDESSSQYPPIAEQGVPAILAHQIEGPLHIYASDKITLLSKHAGIPVSGGPPRPSIMLVEAGPGPGRYRPLHALDSVGAGSIFQQTLREYERLNRDSTLGKTGNSLTDGVFANRLEVFKKGTADLLKRDHHRLYLALLGGQTRNQLRRDNPAYAFAPVSQVALTSLPPAVAVLTDRFPGLARSAAVDLVARIEALKAITFETVLDSTTLQTVQAAQDRSRVISAFASVMDHSDRGISEDAEALFCSLLCMQTRWPNDLKIQIDPGIGVSGRLATFGQPSRVYGPDDATTVIRLIYNGTGYLGVDRTGGVIYVPSGENSLVSGLLRTLDDAQRDALGYRLHEYEKLTTDLLTEAFSRLDLMREMLPVSDQYPLTPGRLSHFRHEDRGAVSQQDNDLYNFDGKLFVTLDGGVYRVLDDREASTPQRKVYRIVRPGDAVAKDPENIYVATRPGRTEPITRNAQGKWVGVVVAGAGGMQRAGRGNKEVKNLRKLTEPVGEAFAEIKKSAEKSDRLVTVWHRLRGMEVESNALSKLEEHYLQHLGLLEKFVAMYVEGEQWLKLAKAGGVYKTDLINTQKDRVFYIDKLILVSDLQSRLSMEKLSGSIELNTHVVDHIETKLSILKRRQDVVDQLYKLDRASALELAQVEQDALNIHIVSAAQVLASNRILEANRILGSNQMFSFDRFKQSEPVRLATEFYEVTRTFADIQLVPDDFRTTVLNNLLEQSVAIRQRFEDMADPQDLNAKRYHDITLAGVRQLEAVLETRLAELHRHRSENSKHSIDDFEQIDFDFIPPHVLVPMEGMSTSRPLRKKVFRVREHGVYKIKVGQARMTPDGAMVLEALDPITQGGILQTYEKRQNEWHPRSVAQAKPAPSRPSEARALLEESTAQLSQARNDERAKKNPTNIFEDLEKKAGELDEVAAQLKDLSDQADLVARLKAEATALREEARNMLIRMYKDKSILNISRLNYLIENRQVRIAKTQQRLERGKGKNKYFLDVYAIRDAQTDKELWHAHFKYDRKDSAPLNFLLKGGHLKTLEQSKIGLQQQIRDAQQGLPHTPIWREAFSTQSAQKLFDLVS